MAEPAHPPLSSDPAGVESISAVSPSLPTNLAAELREVERLIRSPRIREFVLILKKQFFGCLVSDEMLAYHFTLWAQQFACELSAEAVRCSPLWPPLAAMIQTARKEAYQRFRDECAENYASMFVQE